MSAAGRASSERDVIVVGGGPAGAATACFLRQRGHDVLVLDAVRFPRDKVCGEALSPGGQVLLEAMGAAPRVRNLTPWPLRGMRLTSPDGTTFQGTYPMDKPSGLALRRLELDPALLDQARAMGAEVREGTRVTRLLERDGRVVGVEALRPDGEPRRWTSRAVVGADGRHSVVALRLHLRRPHPRLRRFAVRGYWEGMEGLGDHGEMHVGGGGYCGIAPLSRTRANVAFVVHAREMTDARGHTETLYREGLRSRWPRLFERLSRATLLEPPRALGPLAVEARAVAAPGALLVGDAAGFYDPFTGEGITLALRTAQLAAESLHDALDGARASSFEHYARARDAATRDKFRFNRLLQVAVESPLAANLIARRLARRPDLADRLVGIAGDFVPARTAFGRRFLWELLRA